MHRSELRVLVRRWRLNMKDKAFRTTLSAFTACVALTAFAPSAFAGEKTTKHTPPPKKEAAAEPVATTTTDDDAQEESGLALGLRLGYALPMGSIAKDARLGTLTDTSKVASGLVPFWLDVGYRITPNWYVGGYFQFAIVSTSGDLCKALAGSNPCSSSGNNLRFGLTARYTFRPQAKIAPWVGVSSGYEITNVSATAGGQTADATIKGFEFVGLHLGADVRVAREVTVGPMINASFGQYSSDSWSLPNRPGGSADYTSTALHEWIFLGVRGQYDL
jgi:hypothetical protein